MKNSTLVAIRDVYRHIPLKRTGLWVVLAITAITKCIVLYMGGFDAVNTDGIRYIKAAQALASGDLARSLAFYPMPALPALIAAFHTLVPDWVLAARIVSGLFSIVTQVPLYFLTSSLFGPRAAFFATLAFNLHPFGNKMSILVYRGPGYLFFIACALWAMVAALRRPTPSRLMATFAMAVAAASMRIEGIFFLFFFPFSIILLAFKFQRFRWKPVAVSLGWLFFLGTGMFVLGKELGPESFMLNRLGDVITTIRDFSHFTFMEQYMKIYHHLEAMESLSVLPTENQNFGEIARHYLWLIYLVGLAESIARAVYPFYIIPFLVAIKREKLDLFRGYIIISCILYAFLLYLELLAHDYTGRRFVWACGLMLFPWIGRGMEILLFEIRYRFKPRAVKAAIAAMFVFMPLLKVPKMVEAKDRVTIFAAKWLRQSGCANLKLLGNDYRIPFYAHIPFDYMNAEDSPYWHVNTKLSGITHLEKMALDGKRDIIAIKIPKKHSASPPFFHNYKLIKRFDGARRTVLVYATDKASLLCKVKKP